MTALEMDARRAKCTEAHKLLLLDRVVGRLTGIAPGSEPDDSLK